MKVLQVPPDLSTVASFAETARRRNCFLGMDVPCALSKRRLQKKSIRMLPGRQPPAARRRL
jgi:hypothetical protein